jgi:hypothetical protein
VNTIFVTDRLQLFGSQCFQNNEHYVWEYVSISLKYKLFQNFGVIRNQSCVRGVKVFHNKYFSDVLCLGPCGNKRLIQSELVTKLCVPVTHTGCVDP